MKSEGQRLLREVDATGPEIAARVGVTKQSVSYWRRGEKVPDAGQRAILQLAYSIPAASWDRTPATASADRAPPVDAPVKAPPRATKKKSANKQPKKAATTMEEVIEQIDQLRELQREPDLVAPARLKIADSLGKLLAIKARMERAQELLEDRIVREHPHWLRIRAAIQSALGAHPEALEAVQSALARLDEDEP